MNIKTLISKDKKTTMSSLLIITAAIMMFYINVVLLKYVGITTTIVTMFLSIGMIAVVSFISTQKINIALAIEVILLCLLLISCVAVGKLSNTLDDISTTTEYEIVQIAALKTSDIKPEDAFDYFTLGYCNDDEGAYDRSSEILVDNKKEVETSKPFENTTALYNDLLKNNVQLIVLTSNVKSDLSVIDEEYDEKLVVLYEKAFEINPATAKTVDITKEPFTVYFCGADLSSGENISSTGRGDVNILLTVNPNTEEVYMQVIPRDTFVYIPCRGGSSKLSYSGWWGGVQSSIDSIEDKFDIEINYYAKLNFNGLVDLVDVLGGVTVYSHYTYSYQGYDFVEGYNEVDGQKALRFVRARKMLPENELSRGQHQMELIKGIFNKFAENPTYDNGLAVIDSLSNNFVTNLPEEDYYDAFKLIVKLLPQLQGMENHSIKGEYIWHDDEVRDGYYQYYYYPAEGEVEKVKNNIENVING